MHPELQSLLKHRTEVIADHAFRDRDPAGHLDALRDVSERIAAYAGAHQGELDGRLRHYLANSSYQKALDHLSTQEP